MYLSSRGSLLLFLPLFLQEAKISLTWDHFSLKSLGSLLEYQTWLHHSCAGPGLIVLIAMCYGIHASDKLHTYILAVPTGAPL